MKARHHHPGQVHLADVARHGRPDTRINIIDNSRSRRFRWRGRTHPRHGRRSRLLPGRRRGRGDAPDQVRARQGADDWACKPIVVLNKVDWPTRRSRPRANDAFDLFAASGYHRRPVGLPPSLRLRQAGLGGGRHGGPRRRAWRPSIDMIVEHVPELSASAAQARRAGAAVLIESRSVSWPPADRPRQGRKAGPRPDRPRPVPRGRRRTKKADQQDPRVPGPEAPAHRRGRLAGDIVAIAGLSPGHCRRHHRRARRVGRRYCAPAHRSADHLHHRLGEQRPPGGPRRRQGASRVIRTASCAEAERPPRRSRSAETAEQGRLCEVAGRGELQLGVLIENHARREGFEVSISRPRVVYKHRPGKRRRAAGSDRRSGHRRHR